MIEVLAITSMLFSFSIRDSKQSNLADYELMFGAKSKQIEFEIEKERQDSRHYDYQRIEYKKEIENNLLEASYLNNQEDDINILDVGLSTKFKQYSVGGGLVRRNFKRVSPQVYVKINYKYINLKYAIIDKGYILSSSIECKHKIKDGLYLVPKLEYIDSINKSYKAKLMLEWEL